jgi:hypothetical protein
VNVHDAAYHTVHEYPGGSAALASRLVRVDADGNRRAMSEAVLNSKVNANTRTHHLTLAEADQIMALTGDHRILQALASSHGYTLQPVNAPSAGSVMTAMLATAIAKGDLAEVLAAAMADNRITPNEATDISRACAAVQAAVIDVSRRAATEAGVSP